MGVECGCVLWLIFFLCVFCGWCDGRHIRQFIIIRPSNPSVRVVKIRILGKDVLRMSFLIYFSHFLRFYNIQITSNHLFLHIILTFLHIQAHKQQLIRKYNDVKTRKIGKVVLRMSFLYTFSHFLRFYNIPNIKNIKKNKKKEIKIF